MTTIQYCDLADSWVAHLPSGGELWSDSKADLQDALDALEFREQERSDDRFMSVVTAFYVFALAVLTGVAVWGTVSMFWW